ncbi:hypothetical protein [Fimbriimonas ginsengisoli]|nr:hypothetical protein [Fimbriimonas ginsengisoli]
MAQHIEVQVLDRHGQPVNNERVSIFATHIAATGGIPDQWTDTAGVARFDLEIEATEEVILYVKGRERVPRAPLKPQYRVVT